MQIDVQFDGGELLRRGLKSGAKRRRSGWTARSCARPALRSDGSGAT